MKLNRKLTRVLCSALCSTLLMTGTLPMSVRACTNAYYNWTWDDSIDMSNLTVQIYSSDFNESTTTNALFEWNMLTPIYVRRVNYSSNINSGNIEAINVHELDLTGTTIGQTRIYRKNFLGLYVESSISSEYPDICQARIYLDPSLFGTYSHLRADTVTHEMGHAFGLMHPILKNCEERCIMQQSSSGFSASTIQPHDEDNIIAKWGAHE